MRKGITESQLREADDYMLSKEYKRRVLRSKHGACTYCEQNRDSCQCSKRDAEHWGDEWLSGDHRTAMYLKRKSYELPAIESLNAALKSANEMIQSLTEEVARCHHKMAEQP